MRRVTEKEIEAILRLNGQARFERFIKVVADTGEAWGLWDDGWALFEDNSGIQIFPLWPAREYAELCRAPDWLNYEPTQIEVDELLNELIPKLRVKGVLVGVFPTPTGRGVTPRLDEFESALREELKQYE